MIDLTYLRSFRIGPYAIFDTAISYVGIYLLAPILSALFAKMHLNISRSSWLWLTLPISVLFHVLFKQQTALMKNLMNPDHYYIEAIVMLFMLYMGLKGIRSPIVKH